MWGLVLRCGWIRGGMNYQMISVQPRVFIHPHSKAGFHGCHIALDIYDNHDDGDDEVSGG